MLDITDVFWTVDHVVNSAVGRLIFHVDDGISKNQWPNQAVNSLDGQHYNQSRQEKLPHVDFDLTECAWRKWCDNVFPFLNLK